MIWARPSLLVSGWPCLWSLTWLQSAGGSAWSLSWEGSCLLHMVLSSGELGQAFTWQKCCQEQDSPSPSSEGLFTCLLASHLLMPIHHRKSHRQAKIIERGTTQMQALSIGGHHSNNLPYEPTKFTQVAWLVRTETKLSHPHMRVKPMALLLTSCVTLKRPLCVYQIPLR